MMELKIIDRKALDKVKERIKLLLEKSRGLTRYRNREEWLDNQDVCQLLNISLRTLQSYRDRGTLAYSMIGHKCYYKASDVHAFVGNSKNNQKYK